MGGRSYGLYCGLARALEVVGERWSLLLVRALMLGPKRFTDLRHGLPRIPSNVLSTRLRELEDAGVVQRRALPRPASGVVYELTDCGRELEDAVTALETWGQRFLDEPRPDEVLDADTLMVALRRTFRPEMARGLQARYEIRVADTVVGAIVDDGALELAVGGVDRAGLTIDTTCGSLFRFLSGQGRDRAAAGGELQADGDPALLDRFEEIFRCPHGLADAPSGRPSEADPVAG